MSDIAVIGMACKFPHAKDLSALWRVVRTGEVTFEDIPEERWNHASFFDATDLRAADKTYVRKGAFVEGYKEFAALHYGLAPRRVQVMDPQHRLLIEAVRQAIQDAGYDGKSFDRANAGVFVGASVSEHKDLLISRVRAQQQIDGQFGDKLSPAEADALRASVADVVPMRAFSIAGSLLNMGAASISQTFDLGGPSWSMDAACSSALVAIHEAVINLRAGQCSVAFAGGVYLNLQPDNLIGFSRIGAISPSGVCRPFDARADGFVMGEGVGMVMLKKLEDARRDGDRIWAVIKGSGCNNDGRGEGPMTPRPEGQIAAMARAHKDVEFPVDTIGFVETHGTATTVGDATEVGALKSFFQSRALKPADQPYCYLSSIKANIGHTMSAAGVAGFIKAALVLHHRTIPPQPSCEELNPKLELESSPFKIAQTAMAWKTSAKHPRRAAVSSFGFGGTNAHVLLEETPLAASAEVEHPQLFCFSAANEQLLRRYAGEVAEQIDTLQLSCADVALTLSQRQSFDVRLAIVAQGRGQLVERLQAFAKGEDAGAFSTVLAPEARQVAFLFPGQGAQRVGLLRDVVARFPAFARRLKLLDVAVQHDAGTSLLAALYPAEPYDEVAAQALLTRTEVCQPAMAALGLALGEWLKQLGVAPSVVLGHSLGEFVASSVAGMMPGEDAVKLVARRGHLMNKLGLKDPGAMLAVMAERTIVEPLLSGLNNVWLANHNHPTQLVLSGHTASIAAAKKKLEANGLKTAPLDVSHAFHSPLMEGVDDGMRRIVSRLELNPPAVAVASCISGGLYASVDEARDIWVDHATAPVDFVSALETVVEQGAKLFVQVGAGNTLLSFARGVAVKDSAFFSLASAEGGDQGAQLLTTLGQLWVRGVPVNTLALLEGTDARLVMLPPSPLETQTYWGIERPAQRAPRAATPARPDAPPSARPTLSASKTGAPMDSLVSLFREQMALLTQQGEILKAQAAALQAVASGNPGAAATLAQAQLAPVVVKPPNFSNMVAQKEPRAAAAPVVEDVRPQVEAKILASVSRISAFPAAALKMEQALTGELGFDSLMLVELDGDVAKAWPKLGGLPRELFNKNTTIAAVIDHVVGALAKPAQAAAVDKSTAPISRYVPANVAAPLHALRESALSFDGPLLITVDAHGIAKALASRLTARGVEVLLGDATAAGKPAGVIHLADLTSRDSDYRAATKRVLTLANKAGPEAELFITVAGLGGRLSAAGGGRESLGQVGALAFTRALAQEWPDAVVKAIDVELSLGAEAIAQALFDELVSGDRRIEVGYSSGGRVTSELKEARASGPVAAALDAQSVVLVTGGAKGLGLKFARALASKYRCAVVLSGRSPASDETAKACASVKTGGARECSYQVLDVRSTKSVNEGVAAVKAAFGKIDAIVHAAGVIADSLIAKKDGAGIDAVLEPKVGGALALLDATSALKLFVGIGSWAGRFGNAGQTDYASANAMLAALSQRSRPSLRCVTIDFPPWEDSAMAQKIPGFKKREMIEQGVTFLTDEEGLASFLTEVERGTGEVLIGREVTAPRAHHVSSFPVSRLNHLYLNDHQMAGQRVMPLAAAVDHLAAAALDARGAKGSFSIEDFKLLKPVLVPDTIWLSADVTELADGQAVTLRHGTADSYRGVVRPAIDAKELPVVPQVPAYDTLPLSLESFYADFTFHGPRLRGIVSIEGLTDTGVSGWVKGCRPSDWVKEPLRSEWTVDPLLLDSSFQLAGYWAWVKHQRAGFPLGFKRFTQLHPFGAAPVLCTATFEAASGDVMRGTLSWSDSSGKLLAVMEGVEAEFKQRDPQFIAAAAAKKPATAEVSAPAADVPGRTGDADASTYQFDKFPEYEELQERIQMAAAFGLKNPYFSVHEAICGDTTVVNGKEMINFSSYNYVGNSGDPVVSAAAKAAIDKYGTSVSASRVASGEKPLTGELERELARFFGTESSLVFVSGHATNVTVIGHIVGPGDLILHDALAHDSIIGGAKLSGAKRRPFPHNDFDALDRALTSLRPHYRRVLVCIEGTYSMDGDIPDLPKFIAVKKKHQAMLLVDEAHSAGVIGKTGHGIGEYHDVVRSDVDLWMGTLSKSFASCGGYIAGTTALVEYLKYTTPGFVYSVGISPPNAAAALAALQQLEAHPERVKKTQDNAKLFLKLLKDRGIDTGMSKDSAVVPAIVGNSVLCLQLSDSLKDRGINVQPILYPAVEEHLARLRFFVSSLHSEEQLKKTADIVSEELKRLTREMEAVA
jgi:acyl transferase domain-containing protein/7-keto-8-aminopelargonate synthetase-like enzyme